MPTVKPLSRLPDKGQDFAFVDLLMGVRQPNLSMSISSDSLISCKSKVLNYIRTQTSKSAAAMTMKYVLKLLFSLECLIACNTFIFDTTNVTSVTPSTTIITQTAVTTTVPKNYSKPTGPSSNTTLVTTPTPDKEYQQLLNLLIDEQRARLQLEQQLVQLQTNVSDVLDGFEMTLNNTDQTQILKLIKDLERNFSDTVTDVKKEVSDLIADLKDLENQCVNMTDMTSESNLTHQLQNLTIETQMVQDDLLAVKNKTGT